MEEHHHIGASTAARLTASFAAYVVLALCVILAPPSTPWVAVIFLAVSVLNRYVTYCVAWRVARDTGAKSRPPGAVIAVVSANLALSLAVVVPWIVRAAGESLGDVFPVGAACVTIATCCWVGRAACQVLIGVHRWTWNVNDVAYPWSIVSGSEEGTEDTETTGEKDNPLSGYLLSQCNDAADEYYRQTTELMGTVQSARAKLTDDAPMEEKVMSVYSVAAAASRRKDIAADGVRLTEHLRVQGPLADTAIDEPWNSDGAGTLIAEAWDLAASDSTGESPVLDWLVEHVDGLLNDNDNDPTAPDGNGERGADRLGKQDSC